MTFREAYTLYIELMGRAYQYPPELQQTHKELLEELRGIRDIPELYEKGIYFLWSLQNPDEVPPEPLLESLQDPDRDRLFEFAHKREFYEWTAHAIRTGTQRPAEDALKL